MLATIEITPWHWVGFIALILIFLALDLGVFHRKAHVVGFREALRWTLVWSVLAAAFAALVWWMRGREDSLEFITGYIIELSLSMDNVFVIAVIFSYFRVPLAYQHRVLFWGILGALLMRGAMIGLGAALIHTFHWALYVFGGFLVLTGIKMLWSSGDEGVHPERNVVLRLARRLFPITPDFEGERFTSRWNGRVALTPLAMVLLMVETTDLIFAVDSIPAIFAVTDDAFIVFTSNVFAILGLRSLYFVLASAIGCFRFLKAGLSIVLVFIGAKMLVVHFGVEISTAISLGIVAGIIGLAMAASILIPARKGDCRDGDGGQE